MDSISHYAQSSVGADHAKRQLRSSENEACVCGHYMYTYVYIYIT